MKKTKYPLTVRVIDSLFDLKPRIVGPYATPRAIQSIVIKYNSVRAKRIKVRQKQLLVIDPITAETLVCYEVQCIGASNDPSFKPKKRGRPTIPNNLQ
jgi:hypothetical protein